MAESFAVDELDLGRANKIDGGRLAGFVLSSLSEGCRCQRFGIYFVREYRSSGNCCVIRLFHS